MKLTTLLLAPLALQTVVTAQLPREFEAGTFAQPPQITYPTGLAVAPTGEVFVSVDRNSSLDRKPGRGKIVRCVDTDGDGKADQFTDFVPDLDSPRGSCFVGDTLYVVHPPFLSAFRDRDGDGVADEHKVLVERLGFDLTKRGADHTSNGVRMGIDGWLYLAIGDYGMIQARGTDGSTLQLDGGGVVRVRPDGSELELYTANTRNIVDVAVSPKLDVFSRDNTNDGKGWNTRFHHLIQLADMGYPRLYKNFPEEHLPSLADYGGGSGTAAYYLDEPGFRRYNDMVFTGDFTTKKLYVHRMQARGGTFKTKQAVFFKTQAIDMDVDGRSRIFVCDWNGGGYRYGKAAVGSVTLITCPSFIKRVFPDLRKAANHELLNHVVSDSAVLRINAQAEILRRGSKGEIARGLAAGRFARSLADRAVDGDVSLYGRIAAIFTLKQLEGTRATAALAEIARSRVSRLSLDLELYGVQMQVREFALRALADRLGELADFPSKLFLKSLEHENPRVVLQAIIGLARLGDPRHAAAILPLAVPPARGEDPMAYAIPHVAAKALIRLRADRACLIALTSSTLRPAAVRALKEIHTKTAVEGLIIRIDTRPGAKLQEDLFAILCRLYHVDKKRVNWKWWGTRPDDRGPYFAPITWEETPKIKKTIESVLGQLTGDELWRAYSTLVRNRIDPQNLDLGDVEFDEVRLLIDRPSVDAWAIPKLVDAAKSKQRSDEIRRRAFHALRKIAGRPAIDAQFSVAADWNENERENPMLLGAFHEFLYSTRLLRDHKALNSNRLKKGPEALVRAMVLLNLAHSPLAAKGPKRYLVNLVRKNLKNPSLVLAIGEMERLEYRADVERATADKNKRLASVAKSTLAKLNAARGRHASESAMKIAGLDYLKALPILMKAKGDPRLGRRIFARAACISCHALSQKEPQRGPYLGDVGGKFDRRYLIQSVLDPNAIIAQGFQTRWFQTKDDDVHVGFVTDDVSGVLELRDIAGVVTRLKKNEIADQGTRKLSMMPPGLAGTLTVHELASLLDFLQSLR